MIILRVPQLLCGSGTGLFHFGGFLKKNLLTTFLYKNLSEFKEQNLQHKIKKTSPL